MPVALFPRFAFSDTCSPAAGYKPQDCVRRQSLFSPNPRLATPSRTADPFWQTGPILKSSSPRVRAAVLRCPGASLPATHPSVSAPDRTCAAAGGHREQKPSPPNSEVPSPDVGPLSLSQPVFEELLGYTPHRPPPFTLQSLARPRLVVSDPSPASVTLTRGLSPPLSNSCCSVSARHPDQRTELQSVSHGFRLAF